MFRKLLKFGTAGALLGGGLWITDQIWYRMVHNNLPDNFVNWLSMTTPRRDTYRYGVSALGAIVLVPLIAGVTGLAGKSPIQKGASPV